EKKGDKVTYIDKGKNLQTGYKDENIERHGILKCGKEKLSEIDAEDIVSIRTNNFGAEVMVNDRENAGYKYCDCVIDPASLDDIMLYYVHRDMKEWS
ncbi:MAG: ABC transporter ATP-binding protein, partial [Ruminococcus sp.]|nr:ABC transporter ATP-binding protein [Ruminococcus sp.]